MVVKLLNANIGNRILSKTVFMADTWDFSIKPVSKHQREKDISITEAKGFLYFLFSSSILSLSN
jgi:hypothetical protein